MLLYRTLEIVLPVITSTYNLHFDNDTKLANPYKTLTGIKSNTQNNQTKKYQGGYANTNYLQRIKSNTSTPIMTYEPQCHNRKTDISYTGQ